MAFVVASQPSRTPQGARRRWRNKTMATFAGAALGLGALVVPLGTTPVVAAAPIPVYQDDSGAYSFEERAADLISRMTLAEKLTQFNAASTRYGGTPAAAIPRLGVRTYHYWNEALHGVARVGEATSLPTGLGIGATWDRDLVREGLAMAADEARALWNSSRTDIGLTYWSPTINMGRDPRWGRAEESFGEDPYLMGEIGGAFVDGLQSDHPKYLKTVATAKHYAANNNENNRHGDSSNMSDKDLREYYLPAFRNVTENHGVASLMTAYNRVNGVPAPAHEFLIEKVARRTWGFNGFITSDCGAIDDVGGNGHNWTPAFSDHRVTRAEASAFSLKAGTDVDCQGGQYRSNLGPAIDQGLLTEDDLDVSLVRTFTTRFRTGEFDSSDPWPASAYSTAKELSAPDHQDIAQKMSEDAIVLLKNEPAEDETDPILPLSKDMDSNTNIVVVGTLADEMVLGDYSANQTKDGANNCSGNTVPCNHPLNGVRETVAELSDGEASVTYLATGDSSTLSEPEAEAIEDADAVIVVVGTRSNDSREESDRSSLNIPRQADLANAVIALNKRTIVYVSSVALVNIEGFRDLVPAILWSTYNGQKQGTALGRVLWAIDGTNPSARLPFTWYSYNSDLPSTKDYALAPHDGTKGRTYQYFTGAVSYPFGHGLSYSDFSYANLRLSKTSATGDDTITASIDVTNTTEVPGRTVVQLYAASPLADGQTRALSKLVAFEKVALKAYQSKTVRLDVKVSDLWYWDEEADAERIDLGTWTFQSGASVADAATTATLEVTAGRTRTLQQVRTIPSGTVLRLDNPNSTILSDTTAAANDQSFYDMADPAVIVQYASSNPAVATVSRSGEVRGVSDGVATITATVTADGTTASDSFAVAVTHAAPRLDSLTVGGIEVDGFDPATSQYTYYMTTTSQAPPALGGVAGEGMTVTVEDAAAIGDSGTVTVSDASGGFTVYTVKFVFAAQFDTVDFADMTDQDLADAQWSIINPNPSTWRTSQDGLEIDSERGDLYQGDDSVAPPANMFVHDAIGSWVATVKISPLQRMEQNYQQAYIGVQADTNNYIKVGYQRNNGNPNVVFLVETNGSAGQWSTPQQWQTGTGVPTPPIYLRLTKEGSTYTGYWSTDGDNFTRIGSPTVRAYDSPRFMLGAFNGNQTQTAARTFVFDGVQVDALPVPAQLESINAAGMDAAGLAAAGWNVRRPSQAMSFTPQGVAIQTEVHDLYQNNVALGGAVANGARNIVYHDAPGDWAATIDVDMDNPPATNYEKVALLGYQDDDNFVFLAYQFDNGRQIELSVESAASRGQRTTIPVTGAPTAVKLRLEKTGNNYRGFYSFDDGNTWEEVTLAPVTFAGSNVKLAFGNYGANPTPAPVATFKSLTVGEPTPPKGPDPANELASVNFAGKTRVDLVDNGGWSFVRESAGAVEYGDEGLTINTEAGGLWGNTSGGKNLFTHNAIGDWMATVHMNVARLNGNYEQAGIGIYGSDSDYIKLVRIQDDSALVQFAAENGGTGASQGTVGTTATDLYLRIVKIGDTYRAFWSPDGVTFTQIAGTLNKAFSAPRFMMFTYNDASSTPDSAVTFTDLTVTEPPTDRISSITFPSSRVDLSQAQAGVNLEAEVDVEDATGPVAVSYGLIPMDINTAGATVTPAGVFTATSPGLARVSVTAKAGLVTATKSALITVIADGSDELTAVAPPEVIVGTIYGHVGLAVLASMPRWSVAPDSVSIEWLLDGVAIPGASGSEYVPVAADAGHELSVAVTGVHGELGSTRIVSAPLAIHAAVADREDLQAAVDDGEARLAVGDSTAFTGSSWSELLDAVAAAEAVVADEDATDADVAQATARVDSAIAGLVARGNTAALTASINAAGQLDSSIYTADSWAGITQAIEAARAMVLAPLEVTQADVAAALTAINAALAGLELTPGPDPAHAELAAVVESVEALGLNEATYTRASWASLQAALTQAANASSPAQAAAAADAVRSALAGLVASVNRSGLESSIILAKKIDGSGYTPASVARLGVAVALAQAILNADRDSVRQADVDKAIRDLGDAMASLEIAAAPPVTPGEDDDDDPQDPGDKDKPSDPPASPSPSTPEPSPSASGTQDPQAQPTLTPAPVPDPTAIVRLQASQVRITLVAGKSVSIPVKAFTETGGTSKLVWKSSKSSVASVSQSGKISARKAGKATITVKAGSKSIKLKVTVLAKRSKAAKVTKVSATGVPKTMKIGQTAWLTGKYSPAKATGVKITFAASKSGAVQLDKTGRLIAKQAGKATITVKAGNKTKKYTVTVTA
ncbi:MAG: glycoside hydrolase family 3 C-terminal domain-containing protein [Bifidobacteriaceae bacterium]|jgi:beta-glucosidase-like glycosyl hydrolase/regulation of enolase protein 1 (concanavalin A-like superfamily)/uncharacterized protein YjdB|nr:glycoside hydrolase family 3 C-terminal domain-containing protein [Bifidobacteriaceae bacterium]